MHCSLKPVVEIDVILKFKCMNSIDYDFAPMTGLWDLRKESYCWLSYCSTWPSLATRLTTANIREADVQDGYLKIFSYL